MHPPYRPKLKVCCIASVAEAQLAVAHGATALGLVSAMPSGPGVVSEATIADVAAWATQQAPQVQTVLLTSLTRTTDIVAQHRRCRTTSLQLVDVVALDELAALRQALPAAQLIQVVHVQGQASVGDACRVAPWVNALLLDSGQPLAAVKRLGGTGRTHDWALSARIRQAVGALGRPVYLAGGLNAANVRQAVQQVAPYGVDLCSSLRPDGHLCPQRLAAFVAALAAPA